MSGLTFSALTIAAVLLADRSDNQPGRVSFMVVALLLFSCGLLVAPWGSVA